MKRGIQISVANYRKYIYTSTIVLVLFAIPFYSYAQNDEFGEFENFEQEDEFGEFESFSDSLSTPGEEHNHSCSNSEGCSGKRNKNMNWVWGVLGFTALSGVFVRYKNLRKYRGLFLLAALVVLGFYRSGCPCPIMSFQKGILWVLGEEVHWQSMAWFVGLVPVTYIFGRTWCGWVCHLGALQEFIFLPGRVKILQGEKAQKVMRFTRMALLGVLIVQLVITHTNLFKIIDPFKAAFNLRPGNITAWILLVLLLLSSIFIYRPFCKTTCPIGLILGWVGKIPGASVIGQKGDCSACVSCFNACKIKAITRNNKVSKIDNQECIGCGECLQGCNKNSLAFFRNNKNNRSEVICKKM